MSIVSVSLQHVAAFASLAFLSPSPFLVDGSEGLHQLSCLTLWAFSSFRASDVLEDHPFHVDLLRKRVDSLRSVQCPYNEGKSRGGSSRNRPALSSSCNTQRNPRNRPNVETSFRDADPLRSCRDFANTGLPLPLLPELQFRSACPSTPRRHRALIKASVVRVRNRAVSNDRFDVAHDLAVVGSENPHIAALGVV